MATEAECDSKPIYDARLAVALAQVDRYALGALRRLRGEEEPTLQQPRKRVPKMGDRIVQRKPDPFYPSGAEWFYGRWCALECSHLWTPPAVVQHYLETGDPQLAQSGANESAPRETAASASSLHSTFQGADSPPIGPGWHAAWSAMYAATGHIAGAAECAIAALAHAAAEAAAKESGGRLPPDEHLAVYLAARARLQIHFSEAAREIMEGEHAA